MSEEEKKAIGEIDISKTIESNIDYWRNKCFEQQKEIEELKETLKCTQNSWYEDTKKIEELKEKEKNLLKQLKDSEKELLEVTQNIVSKDKIRDKIKELEEMGQMLTAEQGYWGSPKLLNQMEILKELLGE